VVALPAPRASSLLEQLHPGVKVPKFKPNGDAQARAIFLKRKIKLIHGGLGSGKSVLHFLRYIEQAQLGATDQIHGLFTHTVTQLTSGILPNMEKRLLRCGIRLEYDREPSIEWFRYWEKRRIEIPMLQKYHGIISLFPIGIFIQHGTFHHQSFRQYHSVDFRTLAIDEFFDASEEAIRDLIPRCRCGDGEDDDDDGDVLDIADEDDDDPDCGHLHEVELYGNPPLGKHWIFPWLDRREEAAKKYHVDDSKKVDHQNWELVRRGVGKMVMIRVSTRDNQRNTGRAYIEELESGFSNDVATRYIDGEIVRESAGRAFTGFETNKNVSPVEYDENRLLYVWLDFDLAPRAATFVHVLDSGEYPDQGDRDVGHTHFGVFGEFFNEPEMSNQDFILALIRGGRGAGGDCEYPNARLRGLPENWDGLRSHKGTIVFSGDARGKDKSRHNKDLSSDWQIVRNVLAQEFADGGPDYIVDLPDSNPEPAIRIHATNSKFCTVSGVRTIHIDPRCVHLRKDAEVCEWDEAGHDLRHCGRGFGGTLWMRTHLIVTIGYGTERVAPMNVVGLKDYESAIERSYERQRRTTYPMSGR
jgi:hypothetical protein